MGSAETTAEGLVERLGLEPIPLEGGWFRQTWRGPDGDDARPIGTAIIAMFSDGVDGFSAMHRLDATEIWHFHRGDPFVLLLLHPEGRSAEHVLGDEVQVVVPAGTWMGGRVAAGGRWSLLGATMAPGFSPDGFELGSRDALQAGWPDRAREIRGLTRSGGG